MNLNSRAKPADGEVKGPVGGSDRPPGRAPSKAPAAAPDLSEYRRLHLIGIGGAGMSGIASLLLARGIAVTGSDLKDSVGLEGLRAAGALVFIGHQAEQLDDGGRPDAVVFSSAIPEANPELRRARTEGIRVLARAEVLAALMRGRRAVAVAGTHGKTTTTSMISVLLSRAGLDPTYVIGGDLNESGSGAFHGSGEILVAEADESDGSFLLYQPEIAVVTNVDDDHLDFYAGRDEIEAAFAAFVRGAANVVACWDDPGARRALGEVSRGLLRYGTGDDVDLHLDVEEVGQAGGRGTVRFRDERATLVLAVPGRHNLLNASAAMGVGLLLGVPMREAAEALRSFTGVRRRFERRGAAGGATFVDDYAHHPTEIAATLKAAMPSRRGRLLAVFQPHRFTRTQALWRALGESLSDADVVVFTEVYGAGERPIPGVTGKLLVEALAESAPGKRIVYLPRRSDVAPFLAGEVRDGDLVLTLGAGDITMVGDETLERIRAAGR